MGSKRRKLILSVLMLVMTFACLTSTTYAWFARNGESWTEDFGVNIENEPGVLISLDNVNFRQNILTSQMKEIITTNTGVDYDNVTYEGVTLKQENGKIQFDANGNPLMIKDSVKKLDVPVGDIKYEHEFVQTEADDYLVFDLYFQVVNQDTDIQKFELKLTDETKIASTGPTDVKLYNTLITPEKTYLSGESVSVDPVDAMRLGIVNHNTSKFVIYEPTLGLGSSAIEGSIEDIHNKDKNAMLTYYNATHGDMPILTAAEDGEAFDTLSTYSDNVLGEFAYDTSINDYNRVHLSVLIWLEGWDADYFAGIPRNSKVFDIGLYFKIEAVI